MLQLNNAQLSDKDLSEFKESPEGRFIIQYLEAKAEMVLQTPSKIIRGADVPGYDIEADKQIYKTLSDIIKALVNPDVMRGELMRMSNFFKE